MLEVEQINFRLIWLNDRLANLREHLEEQSYLVELSQQQKEWMAEWDHLNDILRWWSSQYQFVMDRVRGPRHDGFKVAIEDPEEPKPTGSVKARWVSPRTLLRRLDRRGYDLPMVLKEWTRQLIAYGMLDPEDLDGIVFDKPACPFLEEKKVEERQEQKEFDEGLWRVLAKVEEHAKSRGRHGGLEQRQALGIYNRKYHDRRHDAQTLASYIQELASSREKLLPKSYIVQNRLGINKQSITDMLKGLLGA